MFTVVRQSLAFRCAVDILEQLIRRMMTMSVKKGGKGMLGKNEIFLRLENKANKK